VIKWPKIGKKFQNIFQKEEDGIRKN